MQLWKASLSTAAKVWSGKNRANRAISAMPWDSRALAAPPKARLGTWIAATLFQWTASPGATKTETAPFLLQLITWSLSRAMRLLVLQDALPVQLAHLLFCWHSGLACFNRSIGFVCGTLARILWKAVGLIQKLLSV